MAKLHQVLLRCMQRYPKGTRGISTFLENGGKSNGFLTIEDIRDFETFSVWYDRRTKVAACVYENITRKSLDRNNSRSNRRFVSDNAIHPHFRPSADDYRGSGYTKGHLAAAANHPNSNETFSLSNVAPQVGNGFNNGIWRKLEHHVRKLANGDDYTNVGVFTGPLYLARRENDGRVYVKYQVIGANQVAVPSHFYKLIVAETTDEMYDLEGYIIENRKEGSKTLLSQYQVPIDTIEREAGILFEFLRRLRHKIRFVNNKIASNKN